MNDDELEALAKMDIAAPDKGKRQAALDAGLQAFDAAQAENTFQEKSGKARPIHTTANYVWRAIMKIKTIPVAAMASVATISLVGVMTYVSEPEPFVVPPEVSGQDAAVAPLPDEKDVATSEAGVTVESQTIEDNVTASSGEAPATTTVESESVEPKPERPSVTVDELLDRVKESKGVEREFERPENNSAQSSGGDQESEAIPPLARLQPAPEQEDEFLLEEIVETAQKRSVNAEKSPNSVVNLPSLPVTQQEVAGYSIAPSQQTSFEPGLISTRDVLQPSRPIDDRERFEEFDQSPVKLVSREPLSTFSADVDTTSYSFVRRSLNDGLLPASDAVRVEEMVNYFDYDYPLAESREQPFKPSVAVYPTPWNADTKLMHIGIRGYDVVPETRPAANLVFLLDVSGSMNSKDKLPLLKNAFRMLVDNLAETDTVSIVVYAGAAGTVLEPTPVSEKGKILAALDRLRAGGSTAGAEGIRQAYALAESSFKEGGVNRVILATDGDFNVGIHDPRKLKEYVAQKRESGVYLSVLGFGRGNYHDALMQTLAQNGNGVAAYIDTLSEARKVLVEEAASNLFPIATDVKFQMEFNPALVAEYRLIGYETRALRTEDFNNDAVDAGDIGSGHTVTAIYEITPVDSPARRIPDLRYGDKAEAAPSKGNSNEFGFLKMRYKQPGASESQLIEMPVTTSVELGSIDDASDDVRFAAAVAAFGQKLKGGKYLEGYSYQDILDLAVPGRGDDPFGHRAEFIGMVLLAKSAR